MMEGFKDVCVARALDSSSSGPGKDSMAMTRQADCLRIHSSVFSRSRSAIEGAFAAMREELCKLEEDCLVKLDRIYDTQREIMLACQPSRDALADLEENVKKVEKSMESFTTHAANLSHIKLTLARMAGLVSSEGNLAQLVVAPSASRPTFSSFSTDFAAPSLPVSRSPPLTTFSSSVDRVPPLEALLSDYRLTKPMLPAYVDSQSRLTMNSWDLLEEKASNVMNSNYPLYSKAPFSGHDRPFYSTSISPPAPPTTASLPPKPPRSNNNTCFVFYLPVGMTNDNLRALFMQCGTVLNAYVAVDKKTNRPRGFGFVDFASASEAQAAVAKLDKMPLDGKYLSVTLKL